MTIIERFVKSLRHALSGLRYTFKHESNFRIQLIVGLIVFILMFYLPTRILEKAILILVIMIVLILELINTIFERLSDILQPRIHFYIEKVKDIMAAAVLVGSISAVVVGLIIFLPYLI